MELVYLWVEKYKNIHKQGFNFSPRFECKYENDTLTIIEKDKDEYIENFFGDNINVTAIVGKNGSGKSSVLEFLLLILLNKENEYKYFLICLENNNDLVIYKNFDEIIKDINYKIKNSDKEIEECIIDNYQNLYPLSLNNNEFNAAPIQSMENIKNIIDNGKKYSKVQFINDSKDFFLPTKIRINILDSIIEITEEGEEKVQELNKKIKLLLEQKKYTECIESINLLIKIFDNRQKKPLNNFSNFLHNREKIFYEIDVKDIDTACLNFIEKLDIEDIELFEDNKSFNDLSYGEKAILQKLHIILNHFSIKIDIQKYLIFIDEFELGLHPNWQKRIISYMLNFFKLFNVEVDLFITTHSPFLLSDIPKQNIIFLDTYKKDEREQKVGNCKVVDGLKEKKQTFGANIHTLLSDSFFMDDGLMGEFAKNKIQEIMDFINNIKTIEEISTKEEQIKQVIESIGEPFLKRKLLDMYYTKYKDESLKEARKKELRLKRDR